MMPRLFFVFSLFLLAFPLSGVDREFLSRKEMKEAVENYERNHLAGIKAISYRSVMESRLVKNDKLQHHYILTEEVKIDLEENKVYRRVVGLNILGGKPDKKISIGDVDKKKFTGLYQLERMFKGKWTILSVEEDSIRYEMLLFLKTMIFTMQLDEHNLFPYKVTGVMKDPPMKMNVHYKNEGSLYLLENFSWEGEGEFLASKYSFYTDITCEGYKISF